MSMCSSGRLRKKRGEGGRKKEKMTVADGMSFAVAFYGCAVVDREREARALGGKNDGCLFCFLFCAEIEARRVKISLRNWRSTRCTPGVPG